MSTGAPIYLVSACATGEEFVAAFRRYADRTGLFVPIAEPLPSGRKGRVAVTLKDGGIMIEGEVEIVSSARTPSVLHGRVGMTIRFVEPDESSKTVLVELEKARLAMKPPAPSVAPRPATIPAEPRAVPPPPAGRIDASNALAECVAIGDTGALAVVEAAPTKPGPKFVVPSIPPVGGPARPRTPSTPPAGLPRRTSTIPPLKHPTGAQPIIPPPAVKQTQSIAVVPPPRVVVPPKEPAAPIVPPDAPSPRDASADSQRITPTATSVPLVPPGAMSATLLAVSPPPPRPEDEDPDSLGPVAPPPAPVSTRPVEPIEDDDKDVSIPQAIVDEPRRSRPSARLDAVDAEPGPETGPLTAAVEIPEIPGFDLAGVEIAEPTDLSEIPLDPDTIGASSRRTSIGVAVVPDGVTVLPAKPAQLHVAAPAPAPEDDGPRDTTMMPPLEVPPEVARATIEEATPSGDWTLSTRDGAVSIEPAVREKRRSDALPTGDWTIALDSDSPDGWGSPSQVEKLAVPPQPGPPVSAVASSEPIEVKAAPERAPDDSGPKVQIDSTLIEPLTPLPIDPAEAPTRVGGATGPVVALGGPVPAAPGPAPLSRPLAVPTPVPMAAPVATPGGSFEFAAQSTGTGMRPLETTRVVESSSKTRIVVIVASAALVLAVGVVAVVTLTKKSADPAPVQPAVVHDAGTTTSTGAVVPPPADASAVPPPVEDASTASSTSGDCKLEVITAPIGAQILVDDRVLGTSNTTITLPCGVETRLVFRKDGFGSVTKVVAAAFDNKPLRVALQAPLFTVKISSKPTGATVTHKGKSLGVTPMTAKLPGYDAATLVFTKPGFNDDTQKITPKQNNQAVQGTLTKKKR